MLGHARMQDRALPLGKWLDMLEWFTNSPADPAVVFPVAEAAGETLSTQAGASAGA